MCAWRNQAALSCIIALLALVTLLPSTSSADVTTFLDFNNFGTRLNEAASSAGVAAFNAGEVATIQAGIQTKLETAFSDYNVTFTTTSPGGLFETLTFGLTTGTPGLLGLADQIDWRNQTKTDVGRIYTANFAFSLEGGDARAQQIAEITSALAGTAAHEHGHNLGLMHRDPYGDPAVSYSGSPVATGGIQNTHIMATGSTGLTEAGRETDRTFSRMSQAKLDYADGLGTNPGSTNEQGGAHGTAGTAQHITFVDLPSSGLEGRNVIGQISSNGQTDFYSFDAGAGAVFSANIMSGTIFGSAGVDTIIRLYDTDGTTILGQNDDIRWNATTYGLTSGGTSEGLDSTLLNILLASGGTYFLEVDGFGSDTGTYELLMAVTPVAAVPEPSTAAIFLLGGGAVAVVQRRRRKRLAAAA